MSEIDDILQRIEEKIQDSDVKDQLDKKWTIKEVKDWVAIVNGLEQIAFSEIVQFENGMKGLVLDILEDFVGVLVLGDFSKISQWQIVKSTGQVLTASVGSNVLGRVLNGLWEPIDNKWKLDYDEKYPVEKLAPWVITRKWVDQPLETGIKAIDSMIPVGRGQRELIIWDRQTGKTTIAIDTILNQKDTDVKCIYVAIWQKESKIRRVVENLRKHKAMEYTTVINSPASDSAVSQYIAPYMWCAIWEYFMENGQDALIIYDDLSKHAIAYREISLLLQRPPGREAYPGDVFYLHSRLLERAARVQPSYGGGSLTALPIIETKAGDVSAYIPTNVISITDGQIFLDTDLFNSGIKPAIDVGNSVSRVWWDAQTKIMKQVAGKLKVDLATYRELEAFSQFGSDLDENTKQKLQRWERLVEILKQNLNSPIPFYKQVVVVYAWVNGYLDDIQTDQISKFESRVYDKMKTSYKDLADEIQQEKKMTDSIENQIQDLIEKWLKEIK